MNLDEKTKKGKIHKVSHTWINATFLK